MNTGYVVGERGVLNQDWSVSDTRNSTSNDRSCCCVVHKWTWNRLIRGCWDPRHRKREQNLSQKCPPQLTRQHSPSQWEYGPSTPTPSTVLVKHRLQTLQSWIPYWHRWYPHHLNLFAVKTSSVEWSMTLSKYSAPPLIVSEHIVGRDNRGWGVSILLLLPLPTLLCWSQRCNLRLSNFVQNTSSWFECSGNNFTTSNHNWTAPPSNSPPASNSPSPSNSPPPSNSPSPITSSTAQATAIPATNSTPRSPTPSRLTTQPIPDSFRMRSGVWQSLSASLLQLSVCCCCVSWHWLPRWSTTVCKWSILKTNNHMTSYCTL